MDHNMTINVMPSPTWRWMKLNKQDVKVTDTERIDTLKATCPADISESTCGYQTIADIPGGMGYDYDVLMSSFDKVHRFTVKKGVKVAEPLILDFSYEDADANADVVCLEAEDGSEMTVVMKFHASAGTSGQALVQTKLRIGDNAIIHLIQAEKLSSGWRFYNDIGATTGKTGAFDSVSIVTEPGKTWQGMRTDLKGQNSCLATDVGYILTGDDSLDMNYIANHIGKKTNCDITVNGVLRGESRKLFRGTIDLRRGASGAIGNETEDVLMMDDKVVNQTIPVILCDEEDVEGNHGATIGRLDENLLFYLESRGMDQKAVYEMMAHARIDAVINGISNSTARNEVSEMLGREQTEQMEETV